MKKLVTGLSMSLLFLGGLSFAAQKEQSFTGQVMDSQCAKMGSHQMMEKQHGIKSDKDCTLACVKGGGQFVLYVPSTRTVYQLDDQQKPEEYAGQTVQIMGTLDNNTKTIHVGKIQPAS